MLWRDKRPGTGLTEHSTGQPVAQPVHQGGWGSPPPAQHTAPPQGGGWGNVPLAGKQLADSRARDAAHRASQGAVHAADYSKWSNHSDVRSHLR